MIKKYGSIAGKEKMLFHGTSFQNLEKINADGLNRIYAGTHGKIGGSSLFSHLHELVMVYDFLCVSFIALQKADSLVTAYFLYKQALISDISDTA